MQVKVEIEGTAPLLQHRFPEEENPERKSKKRIKEFAAREDCEKALYQDEKGEIYQPASHILGALVRAGARFLFERRASFSSVIKSSVIVKPDAIPHVFQKWAIDRRPVVIQRARIMRARPRFDKWALRFEIEFDEDLIGKDKLKEILDFAGARIGIGDFRPLFGRFMVTKFEEA